MAIEPPDIRETIQLNDGSFIELRAIRPDDAPRLQALHARLSPESIYLRFLTFSSELPLDKARALATVDYQSQMAVVATSNHANEEVVLGVARYTASEQEPGVAEIAIVVEDQYQNRGLGTILFMKLGAYARAKKIHTFVAMVSTENAKILRYVHSGRLPVESETWLGAGEILVKLKTG